MPRPVLAGKKSFYFGVRKQVILTPGLVDVHPGFFKNIGSQFSSPLNVIAGTVLNIDRKCLIRTSNKNPAARLRNTQYFLGVCTTLLLIIWRERAMAVDRTYMFNNTK